MKKVLNTQDNTNIKHYLSGAILGVIVTAVMIMLFAAVMLFAETDRAFASPFATISVAVGTLVAALFTAYKIGDKGYKVGLIVGICCFIIITLIALFVNKGNFSINSLFHLIIFLLSGVIGGIIGVNRKNNRKYI